MGAETVPSQVPGLAAPVQGGRAGVSQLTSISRLSVGGEGQSPVCESHAYVYDTPVPTSPLAGNGVRVGLLKAAAGRANAMGTAKAQTNARITTPAALRIPFTLAPPSFSPVRRDRKGSARPHVHQVADQVPNAECYAGRNGREGELAER